MGKIGQCCCTGGGGECCDPETELQPSITLSGFTAAGTTGDRCCFTQNFAPDSTDPVFECCELLATHTAQIDCKQSSYVIVRDNRPYFASPGCPLPQSRCCMTSYKVAEFQTMTKTIQTNRFAVDIYCDSVSVTVGKELIQCGSEVEPVCRYFVRVVMRYSWFAAVNTTLTGSASRTNTYIHPCYYVTCPDDTHESESCSGDEQCDGNPPFGSTCTTNHGTDPCFDGSGQFCVQRIKYFSTRPSGSITFTDTDVPATPDCDDPDCGNTCSGWSQTVCIASPTTILPPIWCTDPPTVSRVTNNLTLNVTGCDGVVWIDSPGCDIFGVTCFPTGKCASPPTISWICDTIVFPSWSANDDCRFPPFFPTQYYNPCNCGACYMGQPNCSFCAFTCVAQKHCDGTNDGSGGGCGSDCCTYWVCAYDPNIYWCAYNDYVNGCYESNEITLTIDCGSYTQANCCFSPGSITVNITNA